MVNYITSVGVQQFSITIASGSTTGTATISATGSGAFIIYGGINPSDTSNNLKDCLASLTLTNSTTITATRNTSGTNTIVITGCIIDGDTTNLIKSVQFGSVSLTSAQASNTATISAVTNNNAATHFLGANMPNPVAGASQNCLFSVSLSGTTVTATRGGTTFAGSAVVSFVVIEFQGSALNQAVQNFSAAASSGSSWTATITSVNTNNAIIIYGGYNTVDTSTNPSAVFTTGQLTAATTVTVNTSAIDNRARTYVGTVVEFSTGVLNSSVQRGTTTLTGVTSNTSTITSVTATNAGINFLGNTAVDSAGLNWNKDAGAVALTNGTTVTTTKNTATNNITSSWEVFEFPAFSGGVTIDLDFWNINNEIPVKKYYPLQIQDYQPVFTGAERTTPDKYIFDVVTTIPPGKNTQIQDYIPTFTGPERTTPDKYLCEITPAPPKPRQPQIQDYEPVFIGKERTTPDKYIFDSPIPYKIYPRQIQDYQPVFTGKERTTPDKYTFDIHMPNRIKYPVQAYPEHRLFFTTSSVTIGSYIAYYL